MSMRICCKSRYGWSVLKPMLSSKWELHLVVKNPLLVPPKLNPDSFSRVRPNYTQGPEPNPEVLSYVRDWPYVFWSAYVFW